MEAVTEKAAEKASKAVLPDFVLPAEYAFVARALQQMDGVGKVLDPEFEFIASAAPALVEIKGTEAYLKDEVLKKFSKFTASFGFGGK